MKRIFAFLVLILFSGKLQMAISASVQDFQARTYVSPKISPKKTLAYRLHIPKNYQASRKYPLMLALHGAGERGSDDSSQLYHDFTKMWADDSIQSKHPSFVLAPQCPLNNQWVDRDWGKGSYNMDSVPISDDLQAVMEILDSLGKEFSLDANRIYVSGMSMGGYGTWYLIAKYPDRFAAAIPVCGAGDPKKAASIAKLPVWAFHAEDDPTVPVSGSRDMVNALKVVSSSIKYTEYAAALKYGHLSWIPAGKTPDLPTWLFSQARAGVSAVKSPGGLAAPHSGPTLIGSEAGHTDALGKRLGPQESPHAGFVLPLP